MADYIKLTEDETVISLMLYLEKAGWLIESHCLGHTHGCDIIASKNNNKLLVEVKGARAGDNSRNKKREFFDNTQIKTHFGKAIVKIFDDKVLNPNATFAIAHPDDVEIRKAIGRLTPFLKDLEIKHYWVSRNGIVTED